MSKSTMRRIRLKCEQEEVNIDVDVACPEEAALQMIIEAAFKFGAIMEDKPLVIDFSAWRAA